jgi:hypothetical protein
MVGIDGFIKTSTYSGPTIVRCRWIRGPATKIWYLLRIYYHPIHIMYIIHIYIFIFILYINIIFYIYYMNYSIRVHNTLLLSCADARHIFRLCWLYLQWWTTGFGVPYFGTAIWAPVPKHLGWKIIHRHRWFSHENPLISHLVICYIAMEHHHAIKNGKPSISMGHFPWLC